MYALIPLYVLSPIIKKLVDSLNRNLIIYIFSMWLIFSSLLPTIAAFLPESLRPLLTFHYSYNLNYMLGYGGYFIAGYYLLRYEGKISKKLLCAVIVLDTVIISLGTWWKTYQSAAYVEMFKSYAKIFTLILSVAIFLLVKEIMRCRRLGDISSQLIQFFSGLSFGIYLIHNLIVDFVSRLIKLWPASSIWELVLSAFIVFAASTLTIFILAGIKPLCYVFTGLKYDAASSSCNFKYIMSKFSKHNEDKQDHAGA